MLHISSAFDSGAIIVDAVRPDGAELRIRHDLRGDGSAAEFLQWFHFRVSGIGPQGARLRLTNAGATTYPPSRAACWKSS
jgi:hypothetical protein